MSRGKEKEVIDWLQSNIGKIVLPHIGVLKEVREIGAVNDNRKKGDVYLNNVSVSLKDVEGSFLYNRLYRSDLSRLGISPQWFDQKVLEIHRDGIQRNVKWHGSMEDKKFKAVLETLMMSMNAKQGFSSHPADLILTHPKKVNHVLDIALFDFDEFFKLFSENWITYAFRRCWHGQKDTTEHNRAKRILSNPSNEKWSFHGVSGKPKAWREDVPEEERKTCFACSVEIRSPVKWSVLQEFRQSLLDSGFPMSNSFYVERVVHAVRSHFNGKIITSRMDERWQEVLEIATQIKN
ncbi:hypothetical protein PN441_06720 [Spirulina major CS-329]|uniref:hypothetical protein n=1 Tax=Spirulina TaxID=1154 RepID=UPI00232F31A9|nr:MULTISPECIES: hypothetical protein [Spirulina]MDB9496142.1 hypothetical protein [Spirulina subsalsa CS-330]MDB9502760.1 hypothetical protein [Spirulina major CS-329]